MTDITFLLADISFVVANITCVRAEIIFKEAVINSAMATITFVVTLNNRDNVK